MRKKLSFSIIDILVGSTLLLLFVFFAYRIKTNLNYDWGWETIPQFIFRFDEQSQSWVPGILMNGFFTTIRLSFWGIILATIFGVLSGIARTSNIPFLRWLSLTYVETMRNLPPLVIIFIAYFFVADEVLSPLEIDEWAYSLSPFGQSVVSFFFAPPGYLSPFLAALMTLAILEGAYIGEIVRAGIESIERGQWEAAHSLGLTRFQQMMHIILPQTFQRIMPPMAGLFISLIKDSSIVSVISIQELTFQGLELMTSTLRTIEIWTVITIMYLALTLPCSLLAERLEKKRLRTGLN